jgi:Aldehyde dehydrogenase family
MVAPAQVGECRLSKEHRAPQIHCEGLLPGAGGHSFDRHGKTVHGAIANDSTYGLASGVWTSDFSRIYRMMNDINAGNVWINTYTHTRYELPFNGFKDSGYGKDDVLEFTREKAVVIAMGGATGAGHNPFAGAAFLDAD